MTGRKDFEAMLEALINEDQQKARDIFHNIVVAKSKEIYETLLAEDLDLYEKDSETDDTDDTDDLDSMDDTDDLDSMDDTDDLDSMDDTDDLDGMDDTDDLDSMDDTDDLDSMDDEGLEDRVVDLEDALEELKAEFEELMADQNSDDMDSSIGDDDIDLDSEDDLDSETDMGTDMGVNGMNSPATAKPVYEYVNKVNLPKHGDNGVNNKSPVAKPNRMGGTSANIVKGGESATGGTKGGLANPTTKEENFGNMNKPGANVGKTAFKKKVSAPPASRASADRAAASPISGLKYRAK